MSCLVTLGPLAVVVFLYVTNLGQIVHYTPKPTWWERLGR